MPICNKCGSTQATKSGLLGRSIQRYRCKECGHKYTESQTVLKPTFEECCDMFIFDAKQKEGAKNLITLFRSLKMKPSWYHSNSYKCHYKGKRVVYMNVYEHLFRIMVCTTNHISNNINNDICNIDAFLQMLPVEMKNEFIQNIKFCKNCTTCAPGYDIKISGELYKHVCEKSLYYRIDNPTPEQFQWIEKFIHARREYISNHVV